MAVDTGTCPAPVSLTATVQNGTGAVAIKLPDGSTISPGTNVPVAPPPLGETSYLLVDGSRELARASITVSCDSSLVAVDGKCTTPPPPPPAPLRYSVIMGMPSGSVGLPARITGASCATAKIEEAVNVTKYPEVYVNFALYNSMLHTTITPSGLVFGTSQVVAEGGKTMSFQYNPVTNQWMDDDGSLGTAPKYTPFAERDAGWVFNSVADHPDPSIGGWAQNEKMLVYVTRVDGNQPLCEDIVGGVRSGTPVVLDVSHDDFGTWFGFWHFKN